MNQTAKALFGKLHSQRATFINRCEQYARYTLPNICPPDNSSPDGTTGHSFQSVGSQCVNHLSNKLMLTMYAPSRPFVRLDMNSETEEEATAAGVDDTTLEYLRELLAVEERKLSRLLDQRAARPRLFEVIKNLIVTGNALMKLEGDSIQCFGVKRYVVRRSHDGGILDIILLTKVKHSELTLDLQAISAGMGNKDDTDVELYEWVKLDPKEPEYMVLSQWLGDKRLPESYDGRWKKENCPYIPLVWDLVSGNHYGTGLVQQNEGDFSVLDTLSEAAVNAAVLASEFRWLVNPGGLTKIQDFAKSKNGDALAGNLGDINLIQNGKAGQDLAHIQAINADYINRLGRSFLLNSAVTRQAERVTAEEIRVQAEELETALGGTYSRLAADFQTPIAKWLLKISNNKELEKYTEITIITGLDALSRSADLWLLKDFLMDVTGIGGIPPHISRMLNVRNIIIKFATARGLSSGEIILSEEELAAIAQAEAEQNMAQQAAAMGAAVNQQGV